MKSTPTKGKEESCERLIIKESQKLTSCEEHTHKGQEGGGMRGQLQEKSQILTSYEEHADKGQEGEL